MKIYKKIIACLLVGTITLCSNYVNISAKGKTATAPQKQNLKTNIRFYWTMERNLL